MVESTLEKRKCLKQTSIEVQRHIYTIRMKNDPSKITMNANLGRLKIYLFSEIRYQYDTDKTLTQLRFVSEDNEVIGAINWFAVHPTSMNNTNHFVSSDNVGYAAILLEQQMNKNNLPGRVCKSFVSLF